MTLDVRTMDYRYGLKVDYIMLPGTFWVEKDDTAVVEVEGDCGSVHSEDFPPCLCMLADVINHKHGMTAACLTDCLQVGIGRGENKRRSDECGVMRDEFCLLASCLQVFLIAKEVNDAIRLQVIGQTEEELSFLPSEPFVMLTQSCIGIVWPVFIDDIAHEAIVGGRLNAKSPTMADAS